MAGKRETSTAHSDQLPHAPRIRNRRAFADYEISEHVEAGLVLTGTEVKSLRAGNCQLDDAYAHLSDGEVLLIGADIAVYPQAVGALQHEPKRARKCLLHKSQILQLLKLTAQKGMTVIPLAIYFRNGYAKVDLGLGKGKQSHDKRQDVKNRQAQRDIQREMRRRR
ncbi:MAG: SsrA-binding protein SmpB [Planctomycetes bacterium]|nr:SsrA-binding protein SmpB [Planctomycetota bacterium]